jgi:hypothetical protein
LLYSDIVCVPHYLESIKVEDWIIFKTVFKLFIMIVIASNMSNTVAQWKMHSIVCLHDEIM